MNATILAFRRDVRKVAGELSSLPPQVTSDELLSRHRGLAKVLAEAWDQKRSGQIAIEVVEEVTSLLDGFHAIALRAGVAKGVVDAFNAERDDWRAWEAYRATLPTHSRL